MLRLLKAVSSCSKVNANGSHCLSIMDKLVAALKSVTMYKIGTVLALLFKLLQAFAMYSNMERLIIPIRNS
jgi:hypothetical protein